jgi:hypothetical protein
MLDTAMPSQDGLTSLSLTKGQEAERKKTKKKKTLAQVVAVDQLTSVQTERMYAVFSKYYFHHTREQFLKDLAEKDHVILLLDSQLKTIQGFSTILRVPLEKYGVRGVGFYSGDTVLEKDYWGSGTLGIAFLMHLWQEKIKSPFQPVYWFLISKGYKTYLLMANNFRHCYPRVEESTPAPLKKLMDDFYSDRFKADYSAGEGVIHFQDETCCLKEDVASVTQELLKNPRIAFFAEKNPNWNRGHELCCLAEMTVWMPLKYFVKKKLLRLFFKKGRK